MGGLLDIMRGCQGPSPRFLAWWCLLDIVRWAAGADQGPGEASSLLLQALALLLACAAAAADIMLGLTAAVSPGVIRATMGMPRPGHYAV